MAYKTAARAGERSRATFVLRFEQQTEITGGMRLRLWVAPESANDADLFVGIEKRSPTGEPGGFSGYNFVADDGVAKGWLRLSHRQLDEARSTPTQLWHPHRQLLPVLPGEVVPAEVEILPSSTLFEAGSSLRLVVREPGGLVVLVLVLLAHDRADDAAQDGAADAAGGGAGAAV